MPSDDPTMPAPERSPRYRTARRIAAASLLLLVLAVTVFLVESRTGNIPYRGDVVRIPLRVGSFRVSASEGRARYISPGPPDIKPLLDERGPAMDWRFSDQLGAMYSIASTRQDGLRVVMITEIVMSRFVQVDCYVEAPPPPGGAAPPAP